MLMYADVCRLEDLRMTINTVVGDNLVEEPGQPLHERIKRRERTSSIEIERTSSIEIERHLPQVTDLAFSSRRNAGAPTTKP
jgi:hypothetical protein